MCRAALLLLTCVGAVQWASSAKQQVQLSDSYLPVAMQVIAHLTDQMAFEVNDEPKPTKPSSDATQKPTNTWQKPTQKPTTTWQKPTSTMQTPTNSWQKPTTSKPYVIEDYGSFYSDGHSWSMSYGLLPREATTPFHKPGLFAPLTPPKPLDRLGSKTGFILLPLDHNTQYTVIEPQETNAGEPLLSIPNEEVKPLIEPAKDSLLLPPNLEVPKIPRAETDFLEISEDNLQYLSQNVREMVKMANDPDDERLVDVWEGTRKGQDVPGKTKLSSSNLRLLLLYDLLSREAKRLRLSDYHGFSPDVMRRLVDSAGGGARAQLSMALSQMVERKDSEHEYANNRAREMVAELAKDESKLSAELRYLQPLVYTN